MSAKRRTPSSKASSRSSAKSKSRGSSRSSRVARAKPVVGILYGSTSDEAVVQECVRVLDRLGVAHEAKLLSAHRMPAATERYARSARKRGLKSIVCLAGMAAHLPGVVASMTTLPVIGVPLCGSALEGLDALYSMVQMPAGVPVATVAVGKAGAKNAAILAVQILATGDAALVRRLDELKRALAAGEKV